MKIETLGIIITFRCPIQCRHCLFDCGPLRKETMKLKEIREIIHQAFDVGIKSIAFTGGEPFLFFNKLEKGISFASKCGIFSSVATSCYWAKDHNNTFTSLKKLKKAGLGRLSISTDDFHARYVPLKFIKDAINAALTLGIKVEIQCTVTKNTQINKSYLMKNLMLDKEIPIIETNVLPLGRATRYIKRREIAFSSKRILDQPCPFIIKNPVITPDGYVSACCGLGAAEPHGFNPLFLVGNVGEEPLDKIIKVMENDLFFNYLSMDGPYSLLRLLKKISGFSIRSKYANLCDLCYSLTNKQGKKVLRSTLLEIRDQILFKKRLLELTKGISAQSGSI